MVSYSLPIQQLEGLTEVLSEYFGYKQEMLAEELYQSFYDNYPDGTDNIPNKEQYMIDFPYLNEYAVDEGVFDYKRYAPRKPATVKQFDIISYMMDSNHDILLTLSNDAISNELPELLKQFSEEDKHDVICNSLFLVAAIYEKYNKGTLYTDITISEDTIPYVTKVRPEMLKLYKFLRSGISFKDKTPRTITLDNGSQRITLDNSFYWLTDLLDEYLHIYLGVDSLEEAQNELKTNYSTKKGRQADKPAFNLIMFGTFQLLKNYSSLKTKSEQLRLTLGYLELLGFFNEDDKKNDENHINASIAYLEKQGYKPQWKSKQLGDYNISPNNPTIEHYW